jgi:poly-beta-1,6-N-acetyl-D-glucosamine synthase
MGEYVLITAARDEADYIRYALDSVVQQSQRPVRWVVVDDGSQDATTMIVQEYADRHDFISLVRISDRGERHFGRKASAFAAGFKHLQGCVYDYVGNLDADISLAPDYYGKVMSEFERDPRLGIAGGIIYTNIGGRFETTDETLDSVAGAVQLFRRQCFEAVGTYPALKWGGIDAAAEIIARMRGWSVRKLPVLKVYEQRRTGSAHMGPVRARARQGRRFHSLGYDPLFFLLRCVYRLRDRPIVVGSIAELVGFFGAMIRQRPIVLQSDVVRYLRNEQRSKLRETLATAATARRRSAGESH